MGLRRRKQQKTKEKLHRMQLRDIWMSQSIVRLMKPKAMRLAEHVARTGEERNNLLDFVG